MKHMKRILSVLLLISLLPLLPLTAAAEGEAGGTPTPKTVYVSSSGDDATAAVGDKTKPYADFLTAYRQLTQTGGTVVLLDDVTIDLTGIDKTGDAIRIFLPKSEYPISVCGVYHENSQVYSALCLANGTAGVCFELEGDVTFYDMIFRVQFAQNLFFAANGYDLTFGFHITNETAADKAANIMGGAQGSSGIQQNPNKGSTVTVYSGKWNGVYAASFNNTPINGNATVNICGGTFDSVTTCRNKAASRNALKYPVDFHYYGGSPAVIKAFGKEATLHLYNGMTIASDKTDIAEANTVTHAEKSLPAPAYALNFYGTQVTAVNEQGKYSVRFVGTLHSTDYSAVGLLIRTASQTYGGCCEKVYTSILGDFDRYTAEALGGNYLFAWTIQNIPADAGAVTFTVTPFLAVGDTVWYGQEKSVTYQAGILQQ